MTHRAKIDWWIAAALALGVLSPLLGAGLSMTIPLFLGVGICGYPQSYETTDDCLVIRSGLIRRVIPYSAITFVGPSAEGCGHLSVLYGKGRIVIAPADCRVFLGDMESRCQGLIRRGQVLAPLFA